MIWRRLTKWKESYYKWDWLFEWLEEKKVEYEVRYRKTETDKWSAVFIKEEKNGISKD